MNIIIFSGITFVSLIVIFSVLSISLIFNNWYSVIQYNLENQINNKSPYPSLQFPLSYNYSKNIIQDKINCPFIVTLY